jgi:hypothetical protein
VRRSRKSPWPERLVLALSLVLAFPGAAAAQLAWPQYVRLHLGSWHDRSGYDNANLGLAVRWSGGLTVGGFHNSLGRPSYYGGLVVPIFDRRSVRLELMSGVITGYSEASPLDVVAVPTLGWHLSQRNTLQIVFIPRFVIPANAIHLMFERRLGPSTTTHVSDRAQGHDDP